MADFDWAKLAQDIPKEVGSVQEIPDEFKHLYDRDGSSDKYVFKGSKTLFSSMTGAKTEREELRNKIGGLEADLDKYTKLGDFDTLKQLRDKQEEIMAAEAASNGQLDQLRSQSRQQLAELENSKNAKIDALQSSLRTTVMENMINSLIVGAGLTKEGESVIPKILPSHFKVELDDNNVPKIAVVDSKGQPRMNNKMDPMTPAEVITELREQLPSLFRGRAASGGGGGTGNDDSTIEPTNKKPSTWSAQQKANYIREYGAPVFEELLRSEGKARAEEITNRLQRPKATARQ